MLKNLQLRQKQSSRGVLGKRCSENIQQIYKITPMSKCDFHKVFQRCSKETMFWKHPANLQDNTHEVWLPSKCKETLLKSHLDMGVFLYLLLHIFRILFSKKTPGGCFCNILFNDATKNFKIWDKSTVNGKLMQILKSPYMFEFKWTYENNTLKISHS